MNWTPEQWAELHQFKWTEKQSDLIDQLAQGLTVRDVANDLSLNLRTVQRRAERIREAAAKKGYAPDKGLNFPCPDGLQMQGTSTLYKDGEKALEWIKTTKEGQLAQDLAQILDDYEYKPAPKVKLKSKTVSDELLSLYTLTDFHLGMLAWSKETGADWDSDIAAKTMVHAVAQMVSKAPDAKYAILNIQGDFLHFDGLDAVTPTSGHVLDADTRFDRMIELAIDLNVWAIEKMLEKHEHVRVVICEGNHDLSGSAWLRKCLKKIMSKNERVEIDDTPFPYYAHLHGQIMLGFHHGHKKKNTALPAFFSSEPRYRKMWGDAEYCYIHTGHYHQTEQDMSEGGGAIVERHPTLAAPDAHAIRGGYISRRGARIITYHKKLGEVERSTVLPIAA